MPKETLSSSDPTNRREPLPEALDNGAGWEVFDSGPDGQPAASPSQKTLFVPLGTTECMTCGIDHYYAIRRHELAHAKYTPTTFAAMIEKYEKAENVKIEPDCLQVVEDLRISEYQREAGVPMPRTFCDNEREEFKKMWKTRSYEDRVKTLLSRWAMPDDIDWLNRIDYECHSEGAFQGQSYHQIHQLISSIITILHREPNSYNHVAHPTYKNSIHAARHLSDLLRSSKTSSITEEKKQIQRRVQEARKQAVIQQKQAATNPNINQNASASSKQPSDDARDALEQAKQSGALDDAASNPDSAPKGRAAGQSGATGAGQAGRTWAPMKMKYPPLDLQLPGRLRSMYKSHEEGMFIRSLHRYAIDGKVFGKKDKAPGGTILLDASGSMSWTEDEIYSMLEHLPGAQIAYYSGSGQAGELVIVAKGGRHAKSNYLHPSYGANGVDGPALEWLILQEAPRVWVSDGHVNGPGDQIVQHAQRNMLIQLGRIGWIAPQDFPHIRELPKDGHHLVYASGVGKGEDCIQAIIHFMKTNGAKWVA